VTATGPVLPSTRPLRMSALQSEAGIERSHTNVDRGRCQPFAAAVEPPTPQPRSSCAGHRVLPAAK
jgi:hypothetical protein